jgi:C-terminal processing protease CtpA/Prc/Flp pilus assembly protein TadD
MPRLADVPNRKSPRRYFLGLVLTLALVTPVAAQDTAFEDLVSDGYSALGAGNFDDAVATFRRAAELDTTRAEGYYHLACAYSRHGDVEPALAQMRRTLAHGFDDYARVLADPDLKNVRDTDDFQVLFDSVLAADVEASLARAKREPWRAADEHYRVAGLLALQGDVSAGLDHFERALELGYDELFGVFSDPAVAPLRREARFGEIYEAAFEERYGWRDTREQRLWGLMRVWRVAADNFAFFDQVPQLHWDETVRAAIPAVLETGGIAEYYAELEKLVALLHDGHTYITRPPELQRALDAPPLELTVVDSSFVIARLGDSDEIRRQGVVAGMELVTVDGAPVWQRFRDSVLTYESWGSPQADAAYGSRNLLRGPEGTQVTLGLRDLDGNQRSVTLTRESKLDEGERFRWRWQQREPLVETRMLPGGIAYAKLSTFTDRNVVIQFEEAMAGWDLSKLRGVILDVRFNPGGSSTNGWDIISRFIDRPLETARWSTRQYRPAERAWGREPGWYDGGLMSTIAPSEKPRFTGPLAVLVGPWTFSAAEDFLVPLDASGRAVLVGRRTAGSTGQPLTVVLPGGGFLAVCTKRDVYPDGKEFVGFGIAPQVEVEPTREDIASGRDAALEAAVEVIRNWEEHRRDMQHAASSP